MSKKNKVILISVLCLLVFVAVAVVIWFLSPGVHFCWRFASFNLTEANCYILDYETQAVIEQTTLTMKGFELDKDDEAPYHLLSILGYTDLIPEEHRFGGVQTSRFDSDGEWFGVLSYYIDTDENASYDDDEPEIWISLKFVEKPVGWVRYYDGSEEVFRRYFVCADSEEEALRIYKEYKER